MTHVWATGATVLTMPWRFDGAPGYCIQASYPGTLPRFSHGLQSRDMERVSYAEWGEPLLELACIIMMLYPQDNLIRYMYIVISACRLQMSTQGGARGAKKMESFGRLRLLFKCSTKASGFHNLSHPG